MHQEVKPYIDRMIWRGGLRSGWDDLLLDINGKASLFEKKIRAKGGMASGKTLMGMEAFLIACGRDDPATSDCCIGQHFLWYCSRHLRGSCYGLIVLSKNGLGIRATLNSKFLTVHRASECLMCQQYGQ